MQPGTMALVQPEASAEEAILRELSLLIGQRRFEHWFRNKVGLSVLDDELCVTVANLFLLNWLTKQFRAPLAEAAQNVLGPSARLRFEVAQIAGDAESPASAPPATSPSPGSVSVGALPEVQHMLRKAVEPAVHQPRLACAASAGPAATPPAPEQAPPRSGRRFADLADFVAGQGNEMALTAVRQVCRQPDGQLNPLFIHGAIGTGKTHLLEGIYRHVRRAFPSLQVVYLTSEAFANYFTQALREHTMPSFRQRFRSVDLLLLDDVDFLESKRMIQEEFLHTFKQLESHGRQLVIASDRHPRLLTKFSDELRTRFLSGAVCRVEAPDLETRRQIVDRKAARLGADFSPEALQFVAQRFSNNVRELEGALSCLQTYHTMTGKRIGLSVARQVLSDLERDCIKVVRMSDIEQAVCGLFGLQSEDLKSAKRSRSLSQPRMLAMYLARKHTRAAYSEIGQYFGGRNHSTVMSAEKKITQWLAKQEHLQVSAQSWSVAEVMEALEQQLRVG